jgi:hypothetical protein
VDSVGDPALVRMKAKRDELMKKRERLNDRIDYLDRCIADHPERVRRYLARQAAADPNDPKDLTRFEADPRRLW